MKTGPLIRLDPVPLDMVSVKGGFWDERLRMNREVTLPVEYRQCKKTGRIDAWRMKKNSPRPHVFWDSDVAKWIEAAAYSLTTHPDRRLEKRVDAVINLMAAAQHKDGYLNLYHTVVEPGKRWTNLRDQHELYCAGHLMEAAVAYAEATGKQKLLDVMCRYADHIDLVFGRRKGQKRGYPGHEEIELALVKLYRATGVQRYLSLAKYFIDERGRSPNYFDIEARARNDELTEYYSRIFKYFQADVPVREQSTADGHAVRACYLYAGMADVAAETEDHELLKTCRKLWRSIVGRRMYIHGGIGSTRFSERFTFDYDLPNEEAYAETCAAIALVFFAHRMLQIDVDGCYADTIERALYNVIISGVSLDGKRFFYDNYLASHPGVHEFTGQKSPLRQEWFGCACCPPNLARLLASLGQYVYSTAKSGKTLYVHQYVNSQAKVTIGGQAVSVRLATRYPWEEKVVLSVNPDGSGAFGIALRIPGWCKGARLSVNGKRQKLVVRKGYATVRREWHRGDKVELTLPMPVERIEAHPCVRHDAGRIALQRGPVLYCLEETDNGKDLSDIMLPPRSRLVVRRDRQLGVPVVVGKAVRRSDAGWQAHLYRSEASRKVSCRIKAVPYYMWANRGLGEMLVWIRGE